MNRTEYLENCIANLNADLKSLRVPNRVRRNKELALLFYTNDLERARAEEQSFLDRYR